MSFENSEVLILIIPVLAAGVWGWRRASQRSGRNRMLLLLASLLCLIVAAANPSWGTMPESTLSKETNFVVILDVSQSMFCREEGRTRMDQAVSFIKALLPQLSGSSIALITFAGDAQIGSPYTQDSGAVRLFLNSVTPNMTGVAGTRTAPLQTLLAETLSSEGNLEESRRKQAGLLFSDGEFTDGTGKLEQWLKANSAFTLFAFACGKARAPVPKFDLSGPYPNAVSEAQPQPLQALASAGHGRWFSLADSSNNTAGVWDVTSDMRDIVSEGQSIPRYQPVPFVIASVLLLLAYQIFPFPASLRRRAVLQLATLLLLAGLLGMSGPAEKQATFSQALQALKQKQVQKAIDQLHKLKEEGATEEVDVALGNAYFDQGNYDEAISHYREALSRNPHNQRARWNWEVALKRKSHPGPQPPPPPPPRVRPPELPRESQALLKYSDQMEQDQMKEINKQHANPPEFAW